jgi:hypothetical protein
MPEQIGWRIRGETRRDLMDEVHVTIECPRWVLTFLVEALEDHESRIRYDDDPRLNRIADALETIDWTRDVVTWTHHMVPEGFVWDSQLLTYVSPRIVSSGPSGTLSGASTGPVDPSDLTDDELGL